jgi:hypothetical protein
LGIGKGLALVSIAHEGQKEIPTMAQTKLRAAATALNKGAKTLTDVARKIRALDALAASMDDDTARAAFGAVIGDLRAFRATVLQDTIATVESALPVLPVETEAPSE